MNKEFESLVKELIYTVENYNSNRYEMVLKLNSLIQYFCKKYRITCLTSMINNIIYLKFIFSDEIKKNVEIDINQILRKNKIRKLRGM